MDNNSKFDRWLKGRAANPAEVMRIYSATFPKISRGDALKLNGLFVSMFTGKPSHTEFWRRFKLYMAETEAAENNYLRRHDVIICPVTWDIDAAIRAAERYSRRHSQGK